MTAFVPSRVSLRQPKLETTGVAETT